LIKGDTTALASLSGPIEVRLTAELPSKATFEVLIRPLSHVPGTESKSLASIIRSSLEPSLILTKNPRTMVQLVIQALSPLRANNWNTTLAASMINASTLAFLNASSVPMRAAVAAVAVSRTCQGALVVDPSDEELEESKGLGCFAFTFGGGIDSSESNSECVWANWRSMSGNNNEELLEAQKLAKKGAEEVFKLMKQMFSRKQLVDVGMKKAEDEDKDKSDEDEMVE
jgi:exosome complex component RRP46